MLTSSVTEGSQKCTSLTLFWWRNEYTLWREIKIIKVIKIVYDSEIPLLESALRDHKYKKDFWIKAFATVLPVIRKIWNSMGQLK